MQTYPETGQNLSTLLEHARRAGEVRIQRENGETFVLKPETAARSALDVAGIDLDISTSEIIGCIHEGRKAF